MYGKNNPFCRKKGDYLEQTQELPNNRHCYKKEVKQKTPTDILGSSGTGKAMDTWLLSPPSVQRTILPLKNMVQTRVFVGHTVRCTRQYCGTAVTHPWAPVTQPIQSTMQWRPPIGTFQSRSPCCGPASCEKIGHAPRAWRPSCSWHGQKWCHRLYSTRCKQRTSHGGQWRSFS